MDDLAEPVTLRQVLSDEHRRLVAGVRDSLRALAREVAGTFKADVDDLHQLAMEIGCRRVVTYDPARGAFFTYLYETVWHDLVRACSRDHRERLAYETAAKGAAKISEQITTPETADDLERGDDLFLDAPLGHVVGQLLAFYADPVTPEQAVMSAEAHAHLRRRVDDALAVLDETDRHIVVRHFIDDVPLAAVQRELGIEKYSEVRRRCVAAAGRLGRRLKGAG